MIFGWKGYAIVGIVVAGLAATLTIQTLRLDNARIEAARERDRADANAATVKQLRADAAEAARIVADLAGDLARYQELSREDRTAIVRAPVTSGVMDRPAIRALMRGVRRDQGTPDATGPPAAGGAGAAVPGGAPGATGRRQ